MTRYNRVGWLLLLVGSLALFLVVSCGDDPVKPEESEYSVATVTDPETDVGMVLMKDGGEQIAVLGEKDEDGEITVPTGGAFMDPSGETIAYSIGANGLPEFVYTDSWLFHFSNYTDTTVDICGVDTTLVPRTFGAVRLDSAQLANMEKLRNLGAFVMDPVGGWNSMSIDEKLAYGSTAVSVVTCAVGLATAGAGVGIAVAVVGCGATAATLTSMVGFDNVKMFATCVTMQNPNCKSFALDAVDSGVKKVKNTGKKLLSYLPF